MLPPVSILLVCLTTGFLSWQLTSEHTTIRVRIGEYYGTGYTPSAAKGADFVFFQGEPVKIKFDIFNEGPTQSVVNTRGTMPKGVIQMLVLEAPSSKAMTSLNVEVSPSIKLIRPTSETTVKWAGQIILQPESGLEFLVTVTDAQENWPTGIYKLKFKCLLKTATGKEFPVNNDTFSYEIRSVESLGDRIEILRRQAARFFTQGQYREAEKKLDELLRLYPNSSLAYAEKGHIMMAHGKKDRAAMSFKKAIDLLQSRMDTIYLSYAPSRMVEEIIASLAATLRNLQKPR